MLPNLFHAVLNTIYQIDRVEDGVERSGDVRHHGPQHDREEHPMVPD